MLHLGISMSLANILIFLFTEVFIVLMGFHATRLAARYVLHRQLSQGQKIPLTTPSSVVDALPYNSDLQPISPTPKLLLTLCRLFVIAISVYVGATLDGEVMHDTQPFRVTKSIAVSHHATRELTENTGTDISAVAKVSCLRLINDHRGILYKGYMAGSEVICEDGSVTFTEDVLIQAEIRDNYTSDFKGLSLKNMPITHGAAKAGANVSDTQIVYERKGVNLDTAADANGKVTITLVKKFTRNECIFGFHRSPSDGFNAPITLEISMLCDLEEVEFPRMLSAKPEFMPPGISFLLQVIDGMIVSTITNVAPRRKANAVMAMISVPGLAVGMMVALLATGLAIGLWVALKLSDVKSDFTSAKGVAELWGEEKFGERQMNGDFCGLFVALENEGKKAYLGSMDGLSIDEDSCYQSGNVGENSFAASVSLQFMSKSVEHSATTLSLESQSDDSS